jgi:hypothetical protein
LAPGDSRRATADCVLPIRSANSACVRPAARRAITAKQLYIDIY